RVDRCACLAGEDGVAAVDLLVHHRVDPPLAAPGSHGVQQQQRGAGELAAYRAPIRPELLDDLGVPVAHKRCPSIQPDVARDLARPTSLTSNGAGSGPGYRQLVPASGHTRLAAQPIPASSLTSCPNRPGLHNDPYTR